MRYLFVFAAALFFLSTCVSFAAEPALKGNITSTAIRNRTDAPITVIVTLDNLGSQLIEGQAELFVSSEFAPMVVCRSHDMALTNGRQEFRMTLPPLPTQHSASIKIRMLFVGKRATFDLGNFLVMVGQPSEWWHSLCVPLANEQEGALEFSDEQNGLVQNLRLEHYDPAREEKANVRGTVNVSPNYVAVAELPAQAIGYCRYDVVLITGDAFRAMPERQLDALGRWVEAGGSLCIQPDKPVKPYHLQFLNQLIGDRAYETDVENKVSPAFEPAELGVALHECELGRLAVLTRPVNPKEDSSKPAWRRMVAFLWKIRADQSAAIIERGKWFPDLLDMRAQFSVSSTLLNQLDPLLAPRNVRPVPVSILIVVMCVFVLVIGPVDYFLLGALKRRKYTWLLLPITCSAFALFMVELSAHYMGRRDYRATASIVDVGRGGKVLRRNDCQMIFVARQQDVVTRVRNGLFSDLSGTRGNWRDPRSTVRQTLFQGAIPGDYQVTQELPQWTPQINRLLMIGGDNADAPIAWEDIPANLPENGVMTDEHFDAIRRCVNSPADNLACEMTLYNGNRIFRIQELQQWGDGVWHEAPRRSEQMGGLRGGYVPYLENQSFHILPGVSNVPPVTRISPSGAGKCNDLAMLDVSDPGQWLLEVRVPNDGDWTIYRRLYTQSKLPSLEPRKAEDSLIIGVNDRGFSLTGHWQSTSEKSHDGGEQSVCYAYGSPGSYASSTARWHSTALKGGACDVYVWLPSSHAWSPTAQYVVYDGTTSLATVQVDQNSGQGWHLLGRWQFSYGGHRVELNNSNSEGRRVIADSVKFVHVPETP